eukprot:m51a1_g6819 hypothetical protein (325) ;mRNA; f:2638-6249
MADTARLAPCRKSASEAFLLARGGSSSRCATGLAPAPLRTPSPVRNTNAKAGPVPTLLALPPLAAQKSPPDTDRSSMSFLITPIRPITQHQLGRSVDCASCARPVTSYAGRRCPTSDPTRTTACVVLRDIPRICVVVDTFPVWVRHSFRGISRIPPGQHILEIAEPAGGFVRLDLTLAKGEVVVYRYVNGEVVQESDEQTAIFRQLVLSGVLENQFERFPIEALCAEAADIDTVQEHSQAFKRSRYLPEDISELQSIFEAVRESQMPWAVKRYAELLHANYASELVMAEHVQFFIDLGRVLVKHVAEMPDLLMNDFISEVMRIL